MVLLVRQCPLSFISLTVRARRRGQGNGQGSELEEDASRWSQPGTLSDSKCVGKGRTLGISTIIIEVLKVARQWSRYVVESPYQDDLPRFHACGIADQDDAAGGLGRLPWDGGREFEP